MNVGPNQRMSAYVAAKASPLSDSDAISGSPSPWKVFASMATHAAERARRLVVSVKESAVADEEEWGWGTVILREGKRVKGSRRPSRDGRCGSASASVLVSAAQTQERRA